MLGIVLIALLSCAVMYLCLAPIQKYAVQGEKRQADAEMKKMGWLLLGIIMVVAFLIRMVGAVAYKGYETDINCFVAWADMVFENGFGKFYKLDAFTDYPPGYMYVLYVIGGLRSLFHIGQTSVVSIVMTKFPAIVADMVTGWLVYRIASKRMKELGAAILTGIFLLTPAIILDSAVWAQVDSVFTLFVVLMCYLVTEKKLIPAYFAFAIGILVKPQTLIFTPVLLLGIIDQVFLEYGRDHDKKAFQKRFVTNLGFGVLAIGCMALLMVPFGFGDAFKQYTETMGSYPYASVNAYNFWTMLGKNWAPQTETFLGITYRIWGMVIIVALVLFAAVIFFKSKDNHSKYYFVGAFIVSGMFTLSVRMHERYIYPAMILLLLCFAVRPCKKIFIGYMGLSAVIFMNMAHAMLYFDPNNFDNMAPFPIVVSVLSVVTFGYLIYLAVSNYIGYKSDKEEERKISLESSPRKERKKEEKKVIRTSKVLGKMVKIDFILLGVITLVYAVVAFVNLGDKKAPTTQYSFAKEGEVVLDFGKEVSITKIWDFLGYENDPTYVVSYCNDKKSWKDAFSEASPWDAGSVFCWNETQTQIQGRYVRIKANANTVEDSMMELVFTDEKGNMLLPVNWQEAKNLFDEQDMFQGRQSWRNGTYFDEIYHARTAYEMIHHLYCYENTHPPLGKIFIAIGVLLFGMNPFGWRFMGTLFGVMMLPVFYVLSKKLFRETWVSAVTTILFAFDFMHFTQTRIATIDVFVTFFIILMYFFMYLYTQKSFYDTPLKETFIPLGLCGITMGFSWASKWTGIYASAGLFVLFVLYMVQRFREYLYAVKHPQGTTDGISHKEIIEQFYTKFIKTIGFCCIFFLVIPAIIYILSYIPMSDGTGHGLLQRVIDNQKSMFDYHSTLKATHPYSSKWYEWPIMKRPIWYASGEINSHLREGISAFGNPLVWWMGIPAFLMVLYWAVRKKEQNAGYLVISYLSQYLPWVFIGRVVFIYHYFPSVPFVALMIGYCMKKIVDWKPKLKIAMFVYGALAVGLFIMFYPVISGVAVDPDYVKHFLKWFDDWVLIQTW